eukprot:TRINITY_DN36045_c0_g1_i1.p2 TRINITY_DN36045_c0_g1~~TRINITY_DN36045_c0_g1_i1.p2  ORF type:complete len:311 (+),score=119.54 TRINITY_DN36045_c0_g1_i1:222-1154(+)
MAGRVARLFRVASAAFGWVPHPARPVAPRSTVSMSGEAAPAEAVPVPGEASREAGGTGHSKNAEVLKEYEEKWILEQAALRERCVIDDVCDWQASDTFEGLNVVAGVDISFAKDNPVDACVTVVALEYPSMKVLHEVTYMVALDLPYISGFLGFREVPHIQRAVERMREEHGVAPQVILMDGNGVHHPRQCGAACHLGVVTGIPTLGVAKKMLAVDNIDLKQLKASFALPGNLTKAGDAMPIVGASGRVFGYALRATNDSVNPVFVSAGHMISTDTALRLVKGMCNVRVPEPVRQADQRSRIFLRERGLL